jgi:hypothetical protein
MRLPVLKVFDAPTPGGPNGVIDIAATDLNAEVKYYALDLKRE